MRVFIAAVSLIALLSLSGCGTIGGIVGFVAANEQREGSHQVDAEYRGLREKSFAVLVAAPAVLQANRPALTAKVTMIVSDVLADQSGANGFVPGSRVITYQYNRPNWVAKPMGEVAKELGVQRIVFIDINEYRLRDPGNQYIWEGVATALVGVYECDTTLPDDMAYQKRIEVKFPDGSGFTPTDIPEAAVNTELTRRLCDRAAWLFFTHEEKNALKY